MAQEPPAKRLKTENYLEIIRLLLPFITFQDIEAIRASGKATRKTCDDYLREQTCQRLPMEYKRRKGELGSFELILKTGWTPEFTSFTELAEIAVKIPLSNPFSGRTTNVYDEKKVFDYIIKNGSARADDKDNPIRCQRGKWEIELSYARDEELDIILAEKYPNLTMPMKAVSDLFLYFKAITGWSSEVYQQQFLEFKRCLLPLMTDARVIGQAHLIAEHNEGGYVYKEAITFVTSDGTKYELVGIDSDYELD